MNTPRKDENSKKAGHGLWWTLRESVQAFYLDGGPMLGGSLAFYSILATAPILVLTVVLAGTLLGKSTARQKLLEYLQSSLGVDGAEQVLRFIDRLEDNQARGTAALLGTLLLFYAASHLFLQLRQALNFVFGVRVRRASTFGMRAKEALKKRFGTILVVAVSGFFLTALLIMSVALRSVIKHIHLDGFHGILYHAVEFIISTGFLTILFAIFFGVLPDAKVASADLWIGSFFTAVLYGLSTLLLSLYLAHAVEASPYGAVGSIALLLLWLHYNAQVLLLGAEFTAVWAKNHGRGVTPRANAVRIVEEERRLSRVTRLSD